VSWPRFCARLPFEEVDYTSDLEDALYCEDALDLESTPDFDGDSLGLEDNVVYSEDTLDFEGNYWNRNKNQNSIFLLSKQISEEALDVLYGNNMFKLYLHGEGEYHLKKNFTEATDKECDTCCLSRSRGVFRG
jgi:hypothetical protein